MKKQITVLCAALLCLLAAFAPDAAAAPALTTTEAYCIIDAGTGDTHGLKRLAAEVGGNRGVGALGHFYGIVAIDDGGPGVRVAVALDHAQHGKADFRV